LQESARFGFGLAAGAGSIVAYQSSFFPAGILIVIGVVWMIVGSLRIWGLRAKRRDVQFRLCGNCGYNISGNKTHPTGKDNLNRANL